MNYFNFIGQIKNVNKDNDLSDILLEKYSPERLKESPEALLESVDNLLSIVSYCALADALQSGTLLEDFKSFLKTYLSKLPEEQDNLEDYVIKYNSKAYYVNWNNGVLSIRDKSKKELFYKEDVKYMEDVRKEIYDFLVNKKKEEFSEEDTDTETDFSFGDEEESGETKENEEVFDLSELIDSEEDKEKKKRFINLQDQIIPNFINVFIKNKEKRDDIIQILIRHIKDGKSPNLNSDQKRAFIEMFFVIFDIICDDEKLADLFTTNAPFTAIYESKTRKKKKSILDRVSKKLEFLLRIGLSDKRFIARVKRALTMDKVSAVTIKIYRDIILDLVSDIINYIENDRVIYNKIRMILMKKGKTLEENFDSELSFLEKAPPHFPKKLEKMLLRRYKDNPEVAYATMWKIYNNRKRKREQ